MRHTSVLRGPFIVAISLLLIFSCSKNQDMRKSVKGNYGEPDLIEEGGYGTFKWMRYVYAKRSINRVYEFQKSASGCGGDGEWYVYRYGYADYFDMYPLYSEATITHAPVDSARTGDVLIIDTTLSDPDNLVVDYNMYYRPKGAEEFIMNSLSRDQEDYTRYYATISGEEMTTAGIEYYLEMNYYVSPYDKLYTQRLPETGVYTVTVTGNASRTVSGEPQSTRRPVHHLDKSVTTGGMSPISP